MLIRYLHNSDRVRVSLRVRVRVRVRFRVRVRVNLYICIHGTSKLNDYPN